MKTTNSLFKPLLMLALAIVALLTATTSRAGLAVPYTNNATTLHLWHFDGPNLTNGVQNCLTTDVVGGLTLTNIGLTNGETSTTAIGSPPYTNIDLGEASYPGLSNALHCINVTAGANYCFASGGTNANNFTTFVNPTTGAFTLEALVKFDINPTVANGNLEVICGDNQSLTGGRGWQFRIKTAATPQMELNPISVSGPGSPTFPDQLVNLPISGVDAAASGQWYHFAAAYTGYSPTNGDAAGVLNWYWTLLDANRTNADLVTSVVVSGTPGTLGGNPWISVGGSGRTQSGIGNGEGFKGFIDEVRISSVCLKSNQMAFSATGSLNPPTFTAEPATNSLVGYGKTLSLSGLATGTLPIYYQWQQNPGSGYSNVLAQTNNQLVISPVTYPVGGNYQLIASNAYGVKTSTVAQVTIGSSPYGLYGTGTDTNGLEADDTAAAGQPDLHYLLVESADTANLGSNAIVWNDNYPLSSQGGLFAVDDASSAWIGPEGNAGQVDGTYYYNTSFVVDGAVPSTVTLQGTVYVNTALTGILLNGVSTGISDFIASPEKFADDFTITNGFVQGLNTLQFQVTDTTGDYTGLRVGMSAVGQILPAGVPTLLANPTPVTCFDYLDTGISNNVTFSVVAIGRPPMTYQWYNAANNSTSISTAFGTPTTVAVTTNRTLILSNPSSAGDPTNFYCIVTDASGSVTSTVAKLSISSVDIAPVAPNYTNSIYENTTLTYNESALLNGSSSQCNLGLTFGGLGTNSTSGNVATAGVVVTYTPVTNHVGQDSFTYSVTDQEGGTGTGTNFINIVATIPPVLSAAVLSNGNIILSGSGGTPNLSYDVLETTNVATPLASWTDLGTFNFSGTGSYSNSIPVTTNPPSMFFRIRVP